MWTDCWCGCKHTGVTVEGARQQIGDGTMKETTTWDVGEVAGTGVLYVSDQSHHSIAKAAALAGFPQSSVRRLPVDREQRLNTGLGRAGDFRDPQCRRIGRRGRGSCVQGDGVKNRR